jgi:protein gp37
MPSRNLVPRLPAQTFRYFQNTMLAISNIWLCLFGENASISDKVSILRQAPYSVKTINSLRGYPFLQVLNRKYGARIREHFLLSVTILC